MSNGIINVSELVNCIGDGLNYDDIAFQYAVDNYSVVLVPEPSVYYRFQHKVNIPSNTTIIGIGLPYIYNDTATAEPIFNVEGTAAGRIKNVKFENLKIRNGTASTSAYTNKKDGIVVKYCDGFTLENCYITEIEGAYGAAVRYSTKLNFINNTFFRCTYAHVMLLPECENININGNTFDTATITTGESYLVATGGDGAADIYGVKNLWVKQNKFLNNPLWEGVDAHTGENIWIEDNYIENVKFGIMCGIKSDGIVNAVLKNVHILRNTIMQGTGTDGAYGILCKGVSDFTKKAENIFVKDNIINGFGGVNSNDIGTIHVTATKNILIKNNIIDNYAQAAVMLYGDVWNADIIGNTFKNMRVASSPAISASVCVRTTGCYGINIFDNKCSPSDITKAPYFFMTSESASSGGIQIRNNNIKYTSSDIYRATGYVPADFSTVPTMHLTQKYGDIILNTSGKPMWYVNSPKIGYGSLITDVICTGSIVSGSRTLTLDENRYGTYANFPEGMNIKIAGSGAGGTVLNCRVIKNNKTTLEIDTPASTTVTRANLTYQAITFVT